MDAKAVSRDEVTLQSGQDTLQTNRSIEPQAVNDFTDVFQGKTPKEITDYYNQWGNDYNAVEPVWAGPRITASRLHKYIDKASIKNMIDIGAGTGMVGAELHKLGDVTDVSIDGLEPAASFFENSPHRHLYRNHICEFLGNQPLKIADDFYDAAVCCGAFVPGHIPCEGLYEMIRIVKPGGVIVVVMRKSYLNTAPEYIQRLEPLIQEIETHGKVTVIEREETSYYYQNPGSVFVLKVNETGFKSYISNVLKQHSS